jgi:predicted glutamine amidotransferase
MCGIIGFYGNNNNQSQTSDKRRFMLEGLYITALRGQESTGIAVLPKSKGEDPEIYKRALSGADFIEKKNTLRLLSNISSSYGVLGHNRSSTKGAVMDENAHPFQYKHITLIHNGTVQNAEWLIQGKKCAADNDVDSAKVAWAFSEAEPDDLLEKMHGGYSLVWWDARDATLHFARNTEKPMYWVVSENADTMYFASELGMLRMLVDRNDIKIKKEAFFTAPYKHYVFNNPNNVEEYKHRPFQNPAQKSKKRGNQQGAIYQQSSNHNTNHSAAQGKQQQSSSDNKNTSSQTPKSTSTSDTGTVGEISDEGKSYLYSGNDRPHPAQLEKLTRATVEAVRGALQTKDRERNTIALADKYGVEAFKTITAKPVYWKTYHDESRFGCLFLRLDKVNIQVFHANLALWVKCAGMGHVPVEIKGHRLSFDGGDGVPPVFVGEIVFDLFQKMWDNFEKTHEHKKSPLAGEEMIEIGLLRPRFVTVAQFNELVECGCWNCQGIITPKDADIVHWFGQDESWPLCGTCSSQPQVVSEWTKMSQQGDATRKNAVH